MFRKNNVQDPRLIIKKENLEKSEVAHACLIGLTLIDMGLKDPSCHFDLYYAHASMTCKIITQNGII